MSWSHYLFQNFKIKLTKRCFIHMTVQQNTVAPVWPCQQLTNSHTMLCAKALASPTSNSDDEGEETGPGQKEGQTWKGDGESFCV